MKKRQLLTFLLLLLCRFLSAQVIFEPVEGNRLWSTKDGLQFLSRIMEEMEGAQTAIDIEYYWFAEDEAGTRVRDLLIRKAREGVQVRLIMDNLITPFALFSAMGHPFQQFAEMMSRSSATSGCSLVWRSTDLRLLSYGLT